MDHLLVPWLHEPRKVAAGMSGNHEERSYIGIVGPGPVDGIEPVFAFEKAWFEVLDERFNAWQEAVGLNDLRWCRTCARRTDGLAYCLHCGTHQI